MNDRDRQTWTVLVCRKKREESIWSNMEAVGKTFISQLLTVTGAVEQRQTDRQQ